MFGIKSAAVSGETSLASIALDPLIQPVIFVCVCVFVRNGAFKPLFVIPHEKVREDVEEALGFNEAYIVMITTPGQVCDSMSYFPSSMI